MKNVFKKKTCATVVCTFLLVLSSSFGYGNNNTKQRFSPATDYIYFFVLDANHSGHFEAEDLQFLLFIAPLSSNIVFDALLVVLDTNGNGEIDKDEFATVESIAALQNLVDSLGLGI